MSIIKIESEQQGEVQGLDFEITASDGREVAITLPVLGSKNVPTGIMALVGVVHDSRNQSSQEQARVLYQLLESVRAVWPEQGRVLYSLDFEAALKTFTAWFNASVEHGDFDPKA